MDGGHRHSHWRRSQELNFNGGAADTAPGDIRESSPHDVQHLARICDTAETQVRFTERLSSMPLPSPTERIAHISAPARTIEGVVVKAFCIKSVRAFITWGSQAHLPCQVVATAS